MARGAAQSGACLVRVIASPPRAWLQSHAGGHRGRRREPTLPWVRVLAACARLRVKRRICRLRQAQSCGFWLDVIVLIHRVADQPACGHRHGPCFTQGPPADALPRSCKQGGHHRQDTPNFATMPPAVKTADDGLLTIVASAMTAFLDLHTLEESGEASGPSGQMELVDEFVGSLSAYFHGGASVVALSTLFKSREVSVS